MTFEELLVEMQSLLDRDVAVSVHSFHTSLPAEGEEWEVKLRPCVGVGGRLRRGTSQEEDTIAFVIGEERPGRFAHLYLSPEWFIKAEWMGVPGGRQLAIMTGNGLYVLVQPVEHDGD